MHEVSEQLVSNLTRRFIEDGRQGLAWSGKPGRNGPERTPISMPYDSGVTGLRTDDNTAGKTCGADVASDSSGGVRSDLAQELGAAPPGGVHELLGSRRSGLTNDEAGRRHREHGSSRPYRASHLPDVPSGAPNDGGQC